MIALAAPWAGVAIGVNPASPVEAWAAVESSKGIDSIDAVVEGNVTVTPDQAFNGEEITVTLQGFRSNSRILAGSVNLGDIRLPIPGHFDFPGRQPVSDSDGWVTFKSQVPREVPIGPQTLTVEWGNEEQITAPFTVLSAALTVTPGTAVANQRVVIKSTGFTPSSIRGGKGPMGVHQITGSGQSFVTLDGLRLGSTYVPYPIDLDSDGTLYVTMTLPLVDATAVTGELDVFVIDTTGRTGTVKLDIQKRSLTITPLLSPPNSTVTLTGRGFIASNDAPTGNFPVDISYDGAWQSTVWPDGSGNFVTQLTIPH